jgi:hypothetical protein
MATWGNLPSSALFVRYGESAKPLTGPVQHLYARGIITSADNREYGTANRNWSIVGAGRKTRPAFCAEPFSDEFLPSSDEESDEYLPPMPRHCWVREVRGDGMIRIYQALIPIPGSRATTYRETN